jgi:hypothetical protein
VVAEAGSDVLLAAAVDDDSAEGFVEALGVGSGVEEEAAVRGVVHGRGSECDRSAAVWNVSERARQVRIVYGERGSRKHGVRCRPSEMEAGIRKGDQRRVWTRQDEETC